MTVGKLDVVVATHEHADHLSGFGDAKGAFVDDNGNKRFDIGELWLSWTEDPDDPQVQTVQAPKRRAANALSALARRFQPDGGVDGENPRRLMLRRRLEPLAGFGDFLAASGGDGDAAVAVGQMDKVKRLLNEGQEPRYLRPDGRGPVRIPGVSLPHRVYVLGPPTERDLLRGEGSAEREDALYFGQSRESLGLLKVLEQYVRTGKGESPKSGDADIQLDALLNEVQFPFTWRYVRKLGKTDDTDAKLAFQWDSAEEVPIPTRKFFSDVYGMSPGDDSQVKPVASPSVGEVDWRNIDLDWLNEAETLALKLSGDTNNTSLALAIELGEPGKGRVLLFPGDAQVGNWWSWKDLSWMVDGVEVTARDLLRRTVVYKVGHHASHNGTVRKGPDGKPWGLALMESLSVALLPVDELTARKTGGQGKKWDMPAANLYRELLERSGRRVLRSDEPPNRMTVDDASASSAKKTDHRDRLVVPKSSEFVPVPDARGLMWRRAPNAPDPGREGHDWSPYFDLQIGIRPDDGDDSGER